MSVSIENDSESDQDWWGMWWRGTLSLGVCVGPEKFKKKKQQQHESILSGRCPLDNTNDNWKIPALVYQPSTKDVFHPSNHNKLFHQIHVRLRTIICILLDTLYVLQKRLDVKFKQHKCLTTKQSSSELCGTRASFWGRNYIVESCWAQVLFFVFCFYQRGEFPWKSHFFDAEINSTGENV